jgi:L-alanine-DL-glutamate epimerase-like enolase superfamily enzyme
VVKVETDDGVTGIGIGGASPGEIAIRDAFVPTLIGMDPLMSGQVWSTLRDPKLYGRRGHETYAQSSIDFALWDLKAKVAGLPLHRLLGGCSRRIPYYIAGGYYGRDKTLADLQREMAGYVGLGARAVKMKVGAVPVAEDVARVRAVRDAIGPDIRLMLDANCAYQAHEAVAFGRRVEEADIFWFEEPVGPDDYEGYGRIGSKLAIPLAAGEQEYGKFGFRDLIATGGVAFLQPDARLTGGVTEFMKIAALAETHGLSISSHGDQQMHAALMAATPNGSYIECYTEVVDPKHSVFYRAPLQPSADGYIELPDTPGAGWDVDEAAMRPFRVAAG